MSIVPHTRQPAEAIAPVELEPRHRWMAMLSDVSQLAHAVANTNFVPAGMRGDEAAITAAILYGDEVGLSPMQSLAKIAVIDGRPSMAAEAQRALILAAGHDFWVEDSSITRVTVAGRRRGAAEIIRVTWTIDDAARAGIAGKQNWRRYPRQMLLARSSAELARALFADAIGGLGATEEYEDADGTEAPVSADVPQEAAQPKSTRRRRQTRPRRAVVAPPGPTGTAANEPELPEEEDPTETAAKATRPQLQKMLAMFRERGMQDRDQRLDWTNARLGRTVVSASEMTADEVSSLIDALADDGEFTDEQASEEHAGGYGPMADAETVEWLETARQEAGVSDDWLRSYLGSVGASEIPKTITPAVFETLTQEQALELGGRLSAAVEERDEGGST